MRRHVVMAICVLLGAASLPSFPARGGSIEAVFSAIEGPWYGEDDGIYRAWWTGGAFDSMTPWRHSGGTLRIVEGDEELRLELELSSNSSQFSAGDVYFLEIKGGPVPMSGIYTWSRELADRSEVVFWKHERFQSSGEAVTSASGVKLGVRDGSLLIGFIGGNTYCQDGQARLCASDSYRPFRLEQTQ